MSTAAVGSVLEDAGSTVYVRAFGKLALEVDERLVRLTAACCKHGFTYQPWPARALLCFTCESLVTVVSAPAWEIGLENWPLETPAKNFSHFHVELWCEAYLAAWEPLEAALATSVLVAEVHQLRRLRWGS